VQNKLAGLERDRLCKSIITGGAKVVKIKEALTTHHKAKFPGKNNYKWKLQDLLLFR